MVKRLKDEKAELEQQVEALSEQIMPQSSFNSAQGSKQRQIDFNIWCADALPVVDSISLNHAGVVHNL